LLRQFFLAIPRELDEAAILDRADPLQALWHVVILLRHPALETVAILSGSAAWNDFLGPLVYLNDCYKYTLARAVRNHRSYSSQWSAADGGGDRHRHFGRCAFLLRLTLLRRERQPHWIERILPVTKEIRLDAFK
jgi:hypothetical protein